MTRSRSTTTRQESKISTHFQQGLDGMNLEYTLKIDHADNLYLPKETIRNDLGNAKVVIGCIGGKLCAYVNAVHCIRPNNVKPLGISDAIRLEIIQNDVLGIMRAYLKKHLKDHYSEEYINGLHVKNVECNLTLRCVGGAMPSDVISLFDKALNHTTVHRKFAEKYRKVNTGLFYVKPKAYALKVYDKTAEQHAKGNPLVESRLVRIEVVFYQRSIRRIFKKPDVLISDVLSKPGLVAVCKEYRRVFEFDIVEKSVKPYLNYCVKAVFQSLLEAENVQDISETIARCREYLPDMEILRRALKKRYAYRAVPDNSIKRRD